MKTTAVLALATFAMGISLFSLIGCSGGGSPAPTPSPTATPIASTPYPEPTATPVPTASPTAKSSPTPSPAPTATPSPTPTPPSIPDASVNASLTSPIYTNKFTTVRHIGFNSVNTKPPAYTKDSQGKYTFNGYVQQGGTRHGIVTAGGAAIEISISSSSPLIAGKTYTNYIFGGGSDPNESAFASYTIYGTTTSQTRTYHQLILGRKVTVTKISSSQIELDISGDYIGPDFFNADVANVMGKVTFNKFSKNF